MRKRLGILAALLVLILAAAPGLEARDDAETFSLLEKVTTEKYPDTDSVYVLDETHVDVEETGLSHVFKTQLIKVLTEAGGAEFATLRFDYDPASSYAEVKRITVYRKGGTVEPVPDSRVRDLPQPQHMIYWGPRMKVVSVPKLNPGDAVEISTYSKGFVIAYLAQENDEERYIPPMRGHYYDVVMFEGNRPILKKTYTIVLPKDKPIRAEIFNGEVGSRMDFDETSLTYTFWKENVPAVKREPRMVDDTDAFTKLVLATVQDWPEKSRWFFQVNEDAAAFEWNDAIKAKVDEIIRPYKTVEEQRFALLAWVAAQIRYSGISMGKGEGYTLHPGIMTFDDRAGVCKDIAGMLITMFRAAGWKTYPAMTMAGARVENLPADQFNHCVVAVETGQDEYTMYDPTWCPFSREIWSSAEKPQNYVIGSPRGEVLMETPPAPPEDNFVKIVSRGTLDGSGNLKGTLTITGGAYSETNLRWGVVFSEASAVRPTFEQWIARIAPNAKLTSYTTTDVLDLHTPFRMTLNYEAPGYAMVDGDGTIYLTPPAAKNIISNRRLTDWTTAVDLDERTYDIFLRASRDFQFDESIAIPQGYRLKHAPEVKPVDGESASFEATVKVVGGSLVTRERFIIKKKVIPAEEYASLKKSADGIKKMSEGTVILSR